MPWSAPLTIVRANTTATQGLSTGVVGGMYLMKNQPHTRLAAG
jgi:hypothetical protein